MAAQVTNYIGNAAKEFAVEQQWIKEGRTLVKHVGKPAYAGGRAARKNGEAEADTMKIKGALRRLFLREMEEGWLGAGHFEQVDEQGLLDFIITPVTAGLVHGPLPGSHTLKQNPKTGEGETDVKASGVETVEKAVPSILGEIAELIKAYGPRLLEVIAGGLLIMFGLVTLAKGGKAPDLPVPV